MPLIAYITSDLIRGSHERNLWCAWTIVVAKISQNLRATEVLIIGSSINNLLSPHVWDDSTILHSFDISWGKEIPAPPLERSLCKLICHVHLGRKVVVLAQIRFDVLIRKLPLLSTLDIPGCGSSPLANIRQCHSFRFWAHRKCPQHSLWDLVWLMWLQSQAE